VSAWPLKDAVFMPLINILFSILGIKDKDEDMERWLWNNTRDYLGASAERIGRYGAMGALGMDVSGSLSIGVGIPKDFWEWGGAVGGVLQEGLKAMEEANQGNYGRSMEHLLPVGIANPLKAAREAEEGVTTANKRRVWEESGRPFMPSSGETAVRAIGFRPTRQAVLTARTWEGHRQQAKFNKMRGDIYEKFRAWILSDDRDYAQYGKIIKEARDFNAKIAELGLLSIIAPITVQSMRDQVRRVSMPARRERALLQ